MTGVPVLVGLSGDFELARFSSLIGEMRAAFAGSSNIVVSNARAAFLLRVRLGAAATSFTSLASLFLDMVDSAFDPAAARNATILYLLYGTAPIFYSQSNRFLQKRHAPSS